MSKNNKPTILETTPLSVRVPLDKKGYVLGNTKRPLFIKDYFPLLQDTFFDKRIRRWVVNRKFYHLDTDTYKMYFPRYLLPAIKADILARGGDFKEKELKPHDGASVLAPMGNFKPKHKPQADAIEFVMNEAVGPVRVVTLDPGLGKTVVAFRYTNLSKRRVLIHSSINMEDWVNRINDWVKIDPSKIVYVSGAKALNNLIANVNEIDPVFILMPTQTLRPYMALNKKELAGRPSIDNLCEHLGVHTRIIDEYHLHLETHVKLDMRIKVPVTIMLTATLESSSATVNSILREHLPNKIRFSGSVPNHVDVYDIGFTLNLKIKEFRYKRMGMYSHVKLEEWLLDGGIHFNNKIIRRVYDRIIDEHYYSLRKKGQVCVVLVATTAYGEYLQKMFSESFPDLKISTFFKSEGVTDIEKGTDLVITTLKSGGTGTDIPNLITVLNTVAVKSSPENKQNVGRLRTIEGVHPRYIFTTWKDVDSQNGYRKGRAEIYDEKARKFFTKDIVAR